MITGTLAWPMKQPGSTLDYALSLACLPADDPVTAASASVMPSGTGEMTPESLELIGSNLVLWLAGGVAGRYYRIKVDVETDAGRTFEWLIGLPIDPELAVSPPTTPPSSGFGTAVTWAPA